VRNLKSDRELITTEDLRGLIKRRARNSHKGLFGHVLILGGAPALPALWRWPPERRFDPGPDWSALWCRPELPRLSRGSFRRPWFIRARKQTPGHSAPTASRNGTDRSRISAPSWSARADDPRPRPAPAGAPAPCQPAPLVVDADALNVWAGELDRFKRTACPVVLTPHPGEMARLMGCRAADVQADRAKAALTAAETGAVVVLKGAGTLVAARDRPLNVNMTGNPVWLPAGWATSSAA